MHNELYKFKIDLSVYQLIKDLQIELQLNTTNEIIKFITGVAKNKNFVNEQDLMTAKYQLKSYQHIAKMTGINNGIVTINIRVPPTSIKYLTDTYLLAGILYLRMIDTEPTSVFQLTEAQLNQLIKTH